MASTTVGLVYSAATGRLRSIVIPDNDFELTGRQIHSGEAMVIITKTQFLAAGNGTAGLQSLVNAVTGLSPDTSDRAVMLDSLGFVRWVGFICTACGDVPHQNFSFEFHPKANIGWRKSAEGIYFSISSMSRRASNLIRKKSYNTYLTIT